MNSENLTQFVLLPFLSLLATFGLFMLDHETESAAQILQPNWIPIYLIYALPAYLACLLFYHWFSKRKDSWTSLVYSTLSGIPTGFSLVMAMFLILKS